MVSGATQLKLTARDGKKYQTDGLDVNGIVELGRQFPGKKANRFMEWFTYSDETLDGKSKQKADALFETPLSNSMELGTEQGIRQIHVNLFGELCDNEATLDISVQTVPSSG